MKRHIRWPILLCGFLAGIYAGLAFVTSPLGHAAREHKPRVASLVGQRLDAKRH
jgi:hypothetical protein